MAATEPLTMFVVVRRDLVKVATAAHNVTQADLAAASQALHRLLPRAQLFLVLICSVE